MHLIFWTFLVIVIGIFFIASWHWYYYRRETKSYNEDILKNTSRWISSIRSDFEEFKSNSIGLEESFIRDIIEAADFFIARVDLHSLEVKLQELQAEFLKTPHSKIICDKIDGFYDVVLDMRQAFTSFKSRVESFAANKKEASGLLPELVKQTQLISKTIHSYDVNPRLKFEFFGITEELRRLEEISKLVDCDWQTVRYDLDSLSEELDGLQKSLSIPDHYSLSDGEHDLEWMRELARSKLSTLKLEDLNEDGRELFIQAKELFRLLDQINLRNPVHFQSIFCMLLDANSILNVILLNHLKTHEAELRDSSGLSESQPTADWREFADDPIEADASLVKQPNPHG